MAFASQQTVEILASDEELKTLETAFDGDERNKLSGAWRGMVHGRERRGSTHHAEENADRCAEGGVRCRIRGGNRA